MSRQTKLSVDDRSDAERLRQEDEASRRAWHLRVSTALYPGRAAEDLQWLSPNDAAVLIRNLRERVDSIESLLQVQEGPGLERAARWHEERAARLRLLETDDVGVRALAKFYSECAAKIRALIPSNGE